MDGVYKDFKSTFEAENEVINDSITNNLSLIKILKFILLDRCE